MGRHRRGTVVMRATDNISSKRWFDGHTPQEHFRDTAHLLARLILLAASMACW